MIERVTIPAVSLKKLSSFRGNWNKVCFTKNQPLKTQRYDRDELKSVDALWRDREPALSQQRLPVITRVAPPQRHIRRARRNQIGRAHV